MNPAQEDCHAVAPDHYTWTYRGSVSCRRPCRRTACRRRVVHFARMLVVPAGKRLPERTIQGSAGRLPAPPPPHLFGPSGVEGYVFAAHPFGSPGPILPPPRRWLLYARDRRGSPHPIVPVPSP